VCVCVCVCFCVCVCVLWDSAGVKELSGGVMAEQVAFLRAWHRASPVISWFSRCETRCQLWLFSEREEDHRRKRWFSSQTMDQKNHKALHVVFIAVSWEPPCSLVSSSFLCRQLSLLHHSGNKRRRNDFRAHQLKTHCRYTYKMEQI
jgi:hypothetical protein